MVLWTSVSKTLKKQTLHICCPVFCRLNIAFAFWQREQLLGAMAWVIFQMRVSESASAATSAFAFKVKIHERLGGPEISPSLFFCSYAERAQEERETA